MCEEYGFKRIKPILASQGGGYIIEGGNEEDGEIGKWLGPRRYKAVLEHNARLGKRRDEALNLGG